MKRLLLTALFLAACGSDVSVNGEIAGLSFDLATVYGWIDATEADVDLGAGKVLFTEREDKDLHLILSGASYDPDQDVRFMSAQKLLEIGLDEERYGSIRMRISNSDMLAAGAVLTDPSPGGDAPELSANHEFGSIRVEPDDVYPAEAIIFGSRRTYTLTVDTVERGANGYVSGTLVVSIERADSDPATVEIGSIDVEFAASLIGERIAECNQSGGDPENCELVLP